MGFRKVDPDKWEFANEGFLRGQKHLLKTIKRRRPPSHAPPPQPPPHTQVPSPFLEVGQYGLDTEVDRLKRDKNTLMAELVKLRQEQQNTRAHLRAMEQRLQGTEQRQQQMMAFLARAMRNPNFLQHLAQKREKRKELEEALSKKRQRPIDQFAHSDAGTSEQQQQYFYAAPELEDLAMEMQGFRTDELNEQQEEVDVELNDEFWQELLNDGVSEEKGKTELDEEGLQEGGLVVGRSRNSGSH